uniref:GDSL esterase/lipase n=1 Tax=Oryza glumipatula TaxID=40148 RepID=A0A0E0BA19_9ORYZ
MAPAAPFPRRLLLSLLLGVLVVAIVAAADVESSAGGGGGRRHSPRRTRYSRVFSFGDSLTDTGNAAILPATAGGPFTRPPYGMTFYHHPTGRASDGRLALGLPEPTPYLAGKTAADFRRGVNFAVGGATALDPAFLKSRGMTSSVPVSLSNETRWFQDVLQLLGASAHEKHTTAASSIFYFGEIGFNDYSFALSTGNGSVDVAASLVPDIIAVIRSAVTAVIAAGARTMVVAGMIPIGCEPEMLALFPGGAGNYYDPASGCITRFNGLAELHNRELQRALHEIRRAHPGAIAALGLPEPTPYLAGKAAAEFRRGANFAVGGATALDPVFLKSRGITSFVPVSLGNETRWFEDVLHLLAGASAHQKHMIAASSVFYFGEIGFNDYSFALSAGNGTVEAAASLVPEIIAVIRSAVAAVIAAGARTVVVAGMIPIGCEPEMLALFPSGAGDYYDPASGCIARFNRLAELHNRELQRALHELRRAHPGAAAAILVVVMMTCPKMLTFGRKTTSRPEEKTPTLEKAIPKLNPSPRWIRVSYTPFSSVTVAASATTLAEPVTTGSISMTPFSPHLVAAAAALLGLLATAVAGGGTGAYTRVFSFGDSLTDTGNALHLPSTGGGGGPASRPPYGETFFRRPTGRASDGRLAVDFIVEALRLRHPAPYLAAGGETAAEFRHGVNFAVGGSTALPPEFYEGRGLKPFVPVSLANQTAWFDKVLQILGSSDHGKKH